MPRTENLSKLLEIIDKIIKDENDNWFSTQLLDKIGSSVDLKNISEHSVIKEIHEYCIEDILKTQATEFFSSFPIIEIKDQLIKDYTKMEYERRRDSFEGFCLSMYQLIENISNFLFKEYVEKIWEFEKHKIAIKTYNTDLKVYEIPEYGMTLEKLVFKTDKALKYFRQQKKWYANNKFRAVLYLVYFNKDVKTNDYAFNLTDRIQNEIYQIRNQNHRYSEQSEYQKKFLDTIKGKEAKYYLKFYGFLHDFVCNIEKNYIDNLMRNPNKHHKTDSLIKAKSNSNIL